MHVDQSLALALLSGIAIAAACGLRAFLPLFAVGLAAHVGWIDLHQGSEWLAQAPALWALGTAAVLEIVGDKIPFVDHALDAVGTLLRPVAAVVGTLAVLRGWGEPWAGIASLVLGGAAFAIHATKAKARLGSSAITLGHANPLLSITEDITSIGLLIAGLLAPLVAAVLVLVLAIWLARRMARSTRRPSPSAPSAERPPE